MDFLFPSFSKDLHVIHYHVVAHIHLCVPSREGDFDQHVNIIRHYHSNRYLLLIEPKEKAQYIGGIHRHYRLIVTKKSILVIYTCINVDWSEKLYWWGLHLCNLRTDLLRSDCFQLRKWYVFCFRFCYLFVFCVALNVFLKVWSSTGLNLSVNFFRVKYYYYYYYLECLHFCFTV